MTKATKRSEPKTKPFPGVNLPVEGLLALLDREFSRTWERTEMRRLCNQHDSWYRQLIKRDWTDKKICPPNHLGSCVHAANLYFAHLVCETVNRGYIECTTGDSKQLRLTAKGEREQKTSREMLTAS